MSPSRIALSDDILKLFGDAHQTPVERALAEMRAGRAVILRDGAQDYAVAAAEFAESGLLGSFEAIAEGPLLLVLSAARLRYLGIGSGDEPMALPIRSADAGRIDAFLRQADVVLPSAPLPADNAARAGMALVKLALLLPSVLIVPIAEAVAQRLPAIRLTTEAVADYRQTQEQEVDIVSRAPVPLLQARDSEFVVFRGGEGLRDQVAIVVGKPDPKEPALVRLHSACLTGDLFGSLRCDCGDQLRGAVQSMADHGGGILLYLDQEGRGNGIANKIRAYRLQHDGMDTYDADEMLGFDLDGRSFAFAAEMLRKLGYTRIRLMTNNPEKIEAMRRSGIDIVGTQRVYGRRSAENHLYLAAKRDKAGHMVEPDKLKDILITAAE